MSFVYCENSPPRSHAPRGSENSNTLSHAGAFERGVISQHGDEGKVTFKHIYTAWQQCRKRKRDKPQAQLYEIKLFDNISNTVQALNDGTWKPLPSVCFTVTKPKMREIHAAHFSDRVVHHYITPLLEELFEPIFIHDVYSNRKNKGTHKAVARTANFMRRVQQENCVTRPHVTQPRYHAERGNDRSVGWAERAKPNTKASGSSVVGLHFVQHQHTYSAPRSRAKPLRSHAPRGSENSNQTINNNIHSHAERGDEEGMHSQARAWEQGVIFQYGNEDVNTQQGNKKGYFLQLDIKNFFYSINRKILISLIIKQLKKSINKHKLSKQQAQHYYCICKAIINNNSWKDSKQVNKSKLQKISAHKRLENTPIDTGLPIGNLTSQFFANVYLNQLDQFVKHKLVCKYYIRYVDDFILLHQSQSQLNQWHADIVDFLASKLLLSIKPAKVKNICNGADFLGYIIRPSYKLVRKRVIGNLYEKLNDFEKQCIKAVGWAERAKPNTKASGSSVVGLHFVQHQPTYSAPRSHVPRGNEKKSRVVDFSQPVSYSCAYKLDFTLKQLEELRAILASYWGHFKHANHWRLQQKIFKKFWWLNCLFASHKDMLIPLLVASDAYSYQTQIEYFSNLFPSAVIKIQKGNKFQTFNPVGWAKRAKPNDKVTVNNDVGLHCVLRQPTYSTPRSRAPRGSENSNQIMNSNMHSHAQHGNEGVLSKHGSHKQMLLKVVAITVVQQGYLKSGLRNRIINSITVKL